MTFQNYQQPITQPQVIIEIDVQHTSGIKAISESGDQLTSGERITFADGNDKEENKRRLPCVEFEIAQLQLFIALCKASIVGSLFCRI